MLKYLKKSLTKNIGIKVFCLVAATLLWIYIAAGQNTIAKYPGSIKIKAINVPAGLVAIYDTKTVNIKIMAEPNIWSKLSIDSFSAYVDLSGQKSGTYELPVNVVSSVAGVDIVEKNPDKIVISLEPIVTKEVSISSKIEGSAGEGLVAGNIDFSFDTSTLRGPKSIVESITLATALVKLNGETEKFTKNIKLIALDEEGEIIENIEFDPAEVTATVSIAKASNNKTVGVRVKTVGAPKEGFFVESIVVLPSTVDITGAASILADVAYVETLPIDLTNQSENFEKEVALSIKNGLALQVGSPSKVRVKISLALNKISRELSATIIATNLNSTYVVTSISPSEAKVICSGPSDIINSLKSSDIVFNLDFSTKMLSETVYSFNLLPQNFKTPEKIEVVSVVPSSINVSLAKK